MYKVYNMDYVTAHLEWLDNHKSYCPAWCDKHDTRHSVLEQVEMWYQNVRSLRPDMLQDLAKYNYIRDVQRMENMVTNLTNIHNEIKRLASVKQGKEYFVTLGFNHQTFTISKALMVMEKIKSFDWVHSCRAVLENFRENGQHPHTHFYIKTDLPKSKVLEKLWATSGIKTIILKKSFIDIKPAEECHKKYIMLEKKDIKMSYVSQDEEWRKENNIPILEKNWCV